MYNNYDDFYDFMGYGKYCTRWVLSCKDIILFS